MSTPPDGPSDDATEPDGDADLPTDSTGRKVDEPTDPTGRETAPSGRETAPFDATVDDRWWWWIAAAPVHSVVSLAFGALFFLVVVLGRFIGTAGGGMGPGAFLPGAVGLLFAAVLLLVIVPGFVIAVVLPVALYVDASAVAAAPDVDWEPEAVLYGLVALVGLLVSGNLVGVVLAAYYLYRRHETVGVP